MIVSSARLFRDGPDEPPSGLDYFPRPHAFRVVSSTSFIVLLTSISLLLLLLVGVDGFEPPCLVRPDLQSGAIDRSATHPNSALQKAQGPESCSELPGLVLAFGLSTYRLELSISIREASCC